MSIMSTFDKTCNACHEAGLTCIKRKFSGEPCERCTQLEHSCIWSQDDTGSNRISILDSVGSFTSPALSPARQLDSWWSRQRANVFDLEATIGLAAQSQSSPTGRIRPPVSVLCQYSLEKQPRMSCQLPPLPLSRMAFLNRASANSDASDGPSLTKSNTSPPDPSQQRPKCIGLGTCLTCRVKKIRCEHGYQAVCLAFFNLS